MLQLENRLLNGILTTRGKISTTGSSYSSPEKSTNASPPVYDDPLGQTFPCATSLACNDNNQWTIIPTQDVGRDFASKHLCLYQHQPEVSTPESLIVSAGSAPSQTAGVNLVDWNRGRF
jgi:hypothetical protein